MPVTLGELQAVQGQQLGQLEGELVRRVLGVGGHPPVVDQVTGAHAVTVGEQADDDLGVPNIDGQQHPFSPLPRWRPNCQ